MAFAAVESGMQHWFDRPPPHGTGACVAFVQVTRRRVAAGGPLVEEEHRGRVASAFVADATASGEGACFFATDSFHAEELSWLLLGRQPIFHPRAWLGGLAQHRRLREQLRRARAKGLRVRRVAAEELVEGSALRAEVDGLAARWLAGRHLEPLAFLAAVEPFHHAEMHRYFVAEIGDRVVGFLSAVPIASRDGWLVEDVFRDFRAPNGTTESMLHGLMLAVRDSEMVTLGLTPLSGPVAPLLRLARWTSRPLYDFAGLEAFRERLHPQAWEPVWMAYPRGRSPIPFVLSALRAFARGSLVGFAVRSMLRRPSGLPWALALPLPAWTLLLLWIAGTRRAGLLGIERPQVLAWAALQALITLVLVRAARSPERSRLAVATGLAATAAAIALAQLAVVGVGTTAVQAMLRLPEGVAPVVGTMLLGWATARAGGESI